MNMIIFVLTHLLFNIWQAATFHNFCLYFLYLALVHPENQLCAFLNYSGVDAVRVIEILCPTGGSFGEYLLVFQTLAIYVDLQGRKSRDREIMYPAFPTYISKF